jgi:hypothetical protein
VKTIDLGTPGERQAEEVPELGLSEDVFADEPQAAADEPAAAEEPAPEEPAAEEPPADAAQDEPADADGEAANDG